jgi:hypothetical protein
MLFTNNEAHIKSGLVCLRIQPIPQIMPVQQDQVA